MTLSKIIIIIYKAVYSEKKGYILFTKNDVRDTDMLNETLIHLKLAYKNATYLIKEPKLKEKSRLKYLDYKTIISLVNQLKPYIDSLLKDKKFITRESEDDFDIFKKNNIEIEFSESLNILSKYFRIVFSKESFDIKCKYSIFKKYYQLIVMRKYLYINNSLITITNEMNKGINRKIKKEYKDIVYSHYSDFYIDLNRGLFVYIVSLLKYIYVDAIYKNLKV